MAEFLSEDHTDTEFCPQVADGSEEAFGFGDDLELNQFDGLPYSSRYYKLLKERKSLPVWKVRCEFLDLLVNNQIVIVSGTTKTGKSSQVSAGFQHIFQYWKVCGTGTLCINVDIFLKAEAQKHVGLFYSRWPLI